MNAAVIVLIVVAALIVAAVAVAVSRRRRLNDGVDSFRRQIDALSPEARRPVVDQVQSVTVQKESPGEPGEVPVDAPPEGDQTDGGQAAEPEASPDEPSEPPAGEDGDRGP